MLAFGNIPNNIFCLYNRANPDGWKWFHHDNEHTLGVRRNASDDNMVVREHAFSALRKIER